MLNSDSSAKKGQIYFPKAYIRFKGNGPTGLLIILCASASLREIFLTSGLLTP